MDKIIYNNITINDNIMLVVQTLIDKQAEIIDHINKKEKFVDDIVSGKTIIVYDFKEKE